MERNVLTKLVTHLEDALQLEDVAVEAGAGHDDVVVQHVELLGVARQDGHLLQGHARVGARHHEVFAGDRSSGPESWEISLGISPSAAVDSPALVAVGVPSALVLRLRREPRLRLLHAVHRLGVAHVVRHGREVHLGS